MWSWDGKDAFGFQAPNENVSSTTFEFNARFQGQWFDKETGLFHNGFRYYNAHVGRYTQSGPLGLEAGWNTYAYVAGNPVSAVDYLELLTVERTNGCFLKKNVLFIAPCIYSGGL